jgi:ribosomal protein S18 acetylase RimI-like enzyme
MTRAVIRPAAPTDYEAYVRLYAALEVPDAPVNRDAWAELLVPRTVVADSSGEVVAYGYARRGASGLHVSQVVVAAAWRGQRLGEEVMRALGRRGRADGASRWSLNVKVENTSAQRLYERLGFRIVSRASSLSVPRSAVTQLAGETAVVQPLKDAALVETELGLPHGAIAASLAATPHSAARVCVNEAETAVAMATFSPDRGGSYFFRAAEQRWARPMLETLFGLAGERPAINVWIEDDDALAEMLLTAGATLNFSTLQMEGAIPA